MDVWSKPNLAIAYCERVTMVTTGKYWNSCIITIYLKVNKSVRLCYHCNNRAPQQVVLSHSADADAYDQDDKVEKVVMDRVVLECSTCGHISLYEKPDFLDWEEAVCVYPRDPDLHYSIPLSISQLYKEAKRVQVLSPSSFAVLVRRSLEALCDDRGIGGRLLVERLKLLSEKGEIPLKLAEFTRIIRELGNAGAHKMNREIALPDTWAMDDFLKVILEYVYVAPSKLEDFKRKWEKRKLGGK